MKNNQQGQSLVEMLIALSMLTVALLGVVALLSKAFFLNRFATNETVATYLASEGIEITKNILDNGIYGGAGWGIQSNGTAIANGDYSADYKSLVLTANNNAKALNLDANNFYEYGAGNATPYNRVVHINIPTSTEIDVISTVTWTSGPLQSESVSLEDHFYDWHP